MTWPGYLRRECRVFGRAVRLTPCECEVLLLLMVRRPFHVPRLEMLDWLYADDPNGGPLRAYTCVQLFVHRLQRKTGWSIESRHGFGYRLGDRPLNRPAPLFVGH